MIYYLTLNLSTRVTSPTKIIVEIFFFLFFLSRSKRNILYAGVAISKRQVVIKIVTIIIGLSWSERCGIHSDGIVWL